MHNVPPQQGFCDIMYAGVNSQGCGLRMPALLPSLQAEAFCAPLTEQRAPSVAAVSETEFMNRYRAALEQRCAGCEQQTLSLKLCGGCKAAGYCR